MTTVLILEDCLESQRALAAIMKGYCEEIHALFASSYKEAMKILQQAPSIDIFFLDINLNTRQKDDKSGLLFGRRVREISKYAFTPIVFITSIAELELVSYRETQCYSYLTKPYNKEMVIKVLEKVVKAAGTNDSAQITVKKDGINYRINANEIRFIEAVPRGILLHMKEEELEIKYTSIKQIMDKLPPEDFIQCHRMFVINTHEIDYVDMVNRLVKLKGCDLTAEIGVTYKPQMRRWVRG